MLARSPLRSTGRLALIVVCLGLVLLLALFLLPVYLDFTGFKGPVEEVLTEVIETAVTVETVEINLSLWPTLRLSGIEVQGSGSAEAPVFTYVRNAEVRLSLLPLLRQELRIKHLGAADLDFHIHRPEDGAGNWPVWTTWSWDITELAAVEIRNITLFLDDHDIGQADGRVERLVLDIAENRPLALEILGSLEGLPLSLAITGPTLENLSPRASSFSVGVNLELAELQSNIAGTVSRQPDSTRLLFEVEAASVSWTFLEALTEWDGPEVGGFEVFSRVDIQDSKIELSDLRGSVGSTAFHSALSVDTNRQRPQVDGTVSLGELDLGPWLEQAGASPRDGTEPLPFELLQSSDAILELSIDRVTGLDHPVEELTASIALTDGDLSAPVRLRLADIPFSADVEILQSDEPTRIRAEVETQDLDLDRLRSLIDLPEGLAGEFGQVTLTASSVGATADELIANLTARIEAIDSMLVAFDANGEEHLPVLLERARIDHRTGEPLTVSATGMFLDEGFRLDLETAPFNRLTDTETLPFTLDLAGSGAAIALDGKVIRREEGPDLDVDFEIAGENLGRLQSWAGLSGNAGLAYRLDGHLTTDSGTRSVRLADSFVGRTHLEGTFSRNPEAVNVPLVADLRVRTLDLEELQEIFDPVTELDTVDDRIGFDIPILPSSVPFGNAEIELSIDRLYREPADLTDIRASLDFQDGQLEPSRFSFDYAGTEIQGELALDLRGELPRFALDISGNAGTIDQILYHEDMIAEARLSADRMEISIDAEGATLRQIVKSADLSGRVTNVRWPIELPESQERLEVRLGEVTLHGPRGEPIVFESEGLVGEAPVDLRLVFRDFGRPTESEGLLAPFRLEARLASTEIDLEGQLTLPITEREFDVNLVVAGQSLSDFAPIIGTDLPPLGPYQLEGRLALNDRLFALQDFSLTLGESDLDGSIEMRRGAGRSQVEARLFSVLTRSRDYLPRLHAIDDSEGSSPAESRRTLHDLDSAKLSLEPLQGFDADVDLEIERLDTGTGPLEHVSVALKLESGHLLLVAQRPQEEDKVAQIAARLEPLDRGGIEADLTVNWERQPYGLLADILNPGEAEGSWSLDLELQTRGSTFEEWLQNLNGHIDFTDYPTDFKATILDLWGGGLLNSLMPVFKIGEQSRINCTVGRLVVDQGIVRPESLILDATRNRVRIRGYVDLPDDELKLRLRPRPKQRNLINLATPVKIRGPVADPRIRFSTGGIAVTAFRLSLWVYTVWVDLLRKPLPMDGSDVCLDPEPRHP